MKTVSSIDYEDMCDSYMGFCTLCQEFTRENTEPDAHEYDCPDCGNNSVMGAEEAMMAGEIEIGEDE